MTQPRYPIGIQNFEDLRSKGFLYVDKTRFIHSLITEAKCNFLWRPRRFGKSLLVSTIEALFEGKRHLFEGLYISETDWGWETNPVLHLDLNSADYTVDDSLPNILEYHLRNWETKFGLTTVESDPPLRFAAIIRQLAEKSGRQVVVLVDEYDKPLLQNLFSPERQERFRNILKAFYSVLKTTDSHIRFALLTGVTKFGKVSVFSDLNNLNDISLDEDFNAICGISDSELSNYFKADIDALSAALRQDSAKTFDDLKSHYDGYHFCKSVAEDIYNPFSLLSAFFKKDLDDFWFETGTPTMLITLLRKSAYPVSRLQCDMRRANELMGLDIALKDPIPVIFQSGYLTIKGYDERSRRYKLGYPNLEVERAWLETLLPHFANPRLTKSDLDIFSFIEDIENDDIDAFLRRLQSLMANIPYDHCPEEMSEGRLHDIVYTVATLIGLDLRTEYHTSEGRIDMLIFTDKRIFIFEFKLDRPVADALRQADRRNYRTAFQSDSRPTTVVAVRFSAARRNISEWAIVD